MGIFIITQAGAGTIATDAFFIPNAIGCATELTPFGEVNNWECVDDSIATPDEDTTYVEGSTPSLKYDLYNIPNHTPLADGTQTGTINYIQIYSRTKSDGMAQHADGIFKIIETDNACANIYKSDDIDLVTSYNTYNKVWTTNPRTSSDWTWANIDNLQIGTECNSPTLLGKDALVLRPNGNGDVIQWQRITGTSNWGNVDDVVADGMTSYNRKNSGAGITDLFDIQTSSELTGRTITEVSVFGVFKVHSGGTYNVAKLAVKPSGGAISYSSMYTIGSARWYTVAHTWLVNPDDGLPWEKSDIDNLQIGVYCGTIYVSVYCTQVYAVIKYLSANPEIRTTQCYAKVNYNKPLGICVLNKPEEISVNHNQNIKMLNFWSGRRAVYGLSRNKRTMVMTGKLYSETACETIECVKNLAEEGTNVSMTGLGSSNYDKVFKILSFGWQKMLDKPLSYKWILECEYVQ